MKRALMTGTGLGIGLTIAEVVAGYWSGGQFPVQWWLVLGLYYVPALAVGVVLIGEALKLAGRSGPVVLARSVSAAFQILFVVYVSLVLADQRLLGRATGLHSSLLVVGAIVAAAALAARAMRPREELRSADLRVLAAWWLLPFGLSLAACVSISHVKANAPTVTALVVVCSIALGVYAWGALLSRTLAARRGLPAAVPACVLLALVVVTGMRWARANRPWAIRTGGEAGIPAAAHPGKPNIVLIVLDTLRASSMSGLGHPRPTTPNLDAFARQGVLFSNCTSTSSSSLPSHASLFTGLMPSRHGAHAASSAEPEAGRYDHPLDLRFDTLAELLLRSGYSTAGIVANGGYLGGAFNMDQGFQHWDSSASPQSLRFSFPPLLYRARTRLPYPIVLYPLADHFPRSYRSAEEINAATDAWLRRSPRRPYFLFINYLDAHHPYAPPARLRKKWAPHSRDGRFPADGLDEDAVVEIRGRARAVTTEEAAHLAALYEGAVAYLDEQVGRLLAMLQSQSDYEETWIIITSDHGESLGEHSTLEHGDSLYQEVIHVPLIVRYPRSLAAPSGFVDRRPRQLTDVLPTILEGLRIPAPPDLDGVPFRMDRAVMIAESFALAGAHAMGAPPRDISCVIAAGYKYIDTSHEPEQLFDLARDPREERNLGPSRPERAAQLRDILDGWKRIARRSPPGPRAPVLTETDRERLRALGYAN